MAKPNLWAIVYAKRKRTDRDRDPDLGVVARTVLRHDTRIHDLRDEVADLHEIVRKLNERLAMLEKRDAVAGDC